MGGMGGGMGGASLAGGAQGLGLGVAPPVAQGAAAAVEDPVQKSNAAAAGAVDLLHNLVQGVTSQVGQKVTEAKDRQNIGKQLKEVQGQVTKSLAEIEMNQKGALGMDVCNFGKEFQEVLRQATDAVEKGEDKVREEAFGKLQGLLKQAQGLVIKKQSILPSTALPPAQPFGGASAGAPIPKDSGGDGGIVEGMVSGWKFQVEATREVLKQAESRRDAELKSLRDLEEKMVSENEKLARIKIEELTTDEILEILSQAVLHIGRCQEAWARLVELFRFIRNLTSFVCEKQLPDFVKLSEGCRDDVQAGDRIVGCLKDQLYQMVVKTSTTAYSCCHLATEYHKISDAYFMPALGELATIYALTDESPELQTKKAQLMQQCAAATMAIKAKVEEKQLTMHTLIQERMETITKDMEKIVGQPDPEIKMLVKEAVNEVRDEPDLYAAPQSTPVGVEPLQVGDLI